MIGGQIDPSQKKLPLKSPAWLGLSLNDKKKVSLKIYGLEKGNYESFCSV